MQAHGPASRRSNPPLADLVYRLVLILGFSLLAACGDDEVIAAAECGHSLTAEEQAAGWRLLFDGKTLEHWRSYGQQEVDPGWGIENGCLSRLGMTRIGIGGDLISREQFGDFELKLEWRISEAGNSGIFIRGDESGKTIHHTGYEMQILDNQGHRDSRDPTHRAGAYYDMIAPDHDTTKPVGYWNRVHIIARGPEVEFWLNGRRTAAFSQGSEEWKKLYRASKFVDRPAYGSLLKGHIGFQDHWDKVWFRNIRILELDS